MTLRLDDDLNERLRQTAEREGRSMQAVAQTAIDRYVSDQRALRDQMIAQIVREDADVLRRLVE